MLSLTPAVTGSEVPAEVTAPPTYPAVGQGVKTHTYASNHIPKHPRRHREPPEHILPQLYRTDPSGAQRLIQQP